MKAIDKLQEESLQKSNKHGLLIPKINIVKEVNGRP